MAARKQSKLTIRPADRVEITVLVDNYTDTLLMEQEGIVRRPKVLPQGPIAEHGLALLVRVFGGQESHAVLMDTGLSEHALMHNAKLLGLDVSQAEALVISHGHWDHLGGLASFLKIARPGLPVVLHPEAFHARRLSLKGGAEIVDLPGLSRETLEAAGVEIIAQREPSTLADGLLTVLGEAPRQTSFEKGFPSAQAFIDGQWQGDPLLDDQGLAVLLRGEGLVVISGCAHAGIVNTVLHAQQVMGEKKIHAVLGGFHLTGSFFKPVLAPTIKALKELEPAWLAPMHCTGWNAANEFGRALPQACLVSTVGTTFTFQGQ